MKVVHYCQHVLGLGHLCRSLAVASALAERPGCEVVFVSGGAQAGGQGTLDVPAAVRMVHLPALMMDEEFAGLHGAGPGQAAQADQDLEAVKARRRDMLLDLLAAERPDAFLVELYPFGRRAFEFELLPALEAVRSGPGRVRVACSLRDILVEKADQAKYEGRVLDRLNRWFDGLLVHADPRLQPLDETFSRVRDITIPVVYTGYVTPRPAPDARTRLRAELGLGPRGSGGERLVVASAGGGKVGAPLLRATAQACAALVRSGERLRLAVFTGPYMAEPEVDALRAEAAGLPGWSVERFTPRFLDWLAACDLSVSMAGYNTAMNLVAAGAYGLAWPFVQNREQRLRADKLARLGVLAVLEDRDLDPEVLAGRIAAALAGPARSRADAPALDLDGAQATARWLTGETAPVIRSV